jgi:EmrB/QacA subfamily drug resistance transporter
VRPEYLKWFALAAASLGMFLGALDLTVNVALPAMADSLGATMSSVQWVIIVYVGTMTGLQLIVGRLADNHGLKRVYLLGIAIYTIAVAAIGQSQTLDAVLGFRAVQAVGYSMMISTGPALVSRLFAEGDRGRGLGFMTSVGTLGMISATLGGGYLIDSFGWSAIFTARVPIGIGALALAYFLLQEHKAEVPKRVDLLGAATLFCGTVAIVLFMNLGGRLGWGSGQVLSVLAIGVVSIVAFITIERKASSPIVRLDVISINVGRALIVAFLMSMATFVNLFLLPFFVADVLGLGSLTLGLLLMLPPIASAICAPIAGWLSDRYNARTVASIALGWLALTTFSFTFLDESSTVTHVGWRLVLFGVGMGTFQASNTNSVMSSMPADALGTGSAMLSLFFGLGMVTSVGLMTSLFEYFRGLDTLSSPSVIFANAFAQTYLIAAFVLVVATVLSMPFQFRLSTKAR